MRPKTKSLFCLRVIIMSVVIGFAGAEAVEATKWYRVDKHTKKGWRESRKWLKKAAKKGVGVADFGAIENLANDGLSLAEGPSRGGSHRRRAGRA